MTPQFENFEHHNSQFNSEHLDSMTDRDFELISAYIDGELSPAERKQVQHWLDQDPQVKSLYTQLLRLQGQMQNLPAPAESESTAQITAQVFQTVDSQRRRRRLIFSGSAIAASLLTAISLFPGANSWRFAQSPSVNQSEADTVMLAVALNTPAINIPKSLNGYQVDATVEE
ncbi:MAG: zf-HC2 domain-containing protein [Cyanobacteria bacterium P01_C01_bin.72]